jgi:hypothetical protein
MIQTRKFTGLPPSPVLAPAALAGALLALRALGPDGVDCPLSVLGLG